MVLPCGSGMKGMTWHVVPGGSANFRDESFCCGKQRGDVYIVAAASTILLPWMCEWGDLPVVSFKVEEDLLNGVDKYG